MLRPLQTHFLLFQQTFFVLVCIQPGIPRVPPWVLASGPKTCGGKKRLPEIQSAIRRWNSFSDKLFQSGFWFSSCDPSCSWLGTTVHLEEWKLCWKHLNNPYLACSKMELIYCSLRKKSSVTSFVSNKQQVHKINSGYLQFDVDTAAVPLKDTSKLIPSYVLKTLVLFEWQENPAEELWSETNLSQRLLSIPHVRARCNSKRSVLDLFRPKPAAEGP